MLSKDINGQLFGRLLPLYRWEEPVKRKGIHLVCWCYGCNNYTITAKADILAGDSTSCGCGGSTHGHSSPPTPTYRSYWAMMTRCYNERYDKYYLWGGRGIAVCPAWVADFTNFLSDMGERPEGTTLERLDGDGDYGPDNCTWATLEEQNSNKADNVLIEIEGVVDTAAGWCRKLSKDYHKVIQRLNRGWSHAEALDLVTRGK